MSADADESIVSPLRVGYTIIGQNVKNVGKIPKWGLYGPQTQFSPQLKVLIFGTCTNNILMCSQVKF